MLLGAFAKCMDCCLQHTVTWLLPPCLMASPICLPVCHVGSDPSNGTEKKMGSFLMMTCFLCTTISSGMFITAMAANPLAVNLAAETLGYTISWGG